MSKNTSGTKESTDRTKATIEGVTTGFEVRSDPKEDMKIKVQTFPSSEGGLVALAIRSEHLNGRVFLTPEQTDEIAAAIQDALGELQEYTG
jgi:hypothetical protein